jgi:hypothetical protein
MPESAPSMEPARRPRHRQIGRRRAVVLTAAIAALGLLGVAIPQFATALPNHNPIGNVEGIAVANGTVNVHGWSVDPDSAASNRIEFRVDGRYNNAILAHDYRSDVAAAHPEWGGYRGYSARLTVGNGTHQLCVVGINVGAGSNTTFTCQTITIKNDPIGNLELVRMSPKGIRVAGWSLDPNTVKPIEVRFYVDGTYAGHTSAGLPRPDVGQAYPYYGSNHGFTTDVPVVDGTHRVCAYGINVGAGLYSAKVGCRSITTTHSPIGFISTLKRASATSTTTPVFGWTLDPDTSSPITARVTVDGVQRSTLAAKGPSTWVALRYPGYGPNHVVSGNLTIDPGQHTVCIVGVNVASGKDTTLACKVLASTGDTTPAAPVVSAWPGNTKVDLTWAAARSVAAPVTGYTITVIPGGRVVRVAGTATSASITGLVNGNAYSFAVSAANRLGTGSATWATARPSAIPPQFTPAPVSTSHYVRNLTGNLTTDAALMRAMGAKDAGYNPSGHRYLVLLQIGGQDEVRKGVLLSATSRFVSYPAVVNAMKAYLDGYASKQKPYAPMTLAVGTNNDVDVSAAAGASWARNVVTPTWSYAKRFPGIGVAGANDIEPGFSATPAESRAWLTGYLNTTGASYVFNGSADGCSTVAPASRCNNGWTMADLQWLGGGAAPTKTINLPQIYNYAMPKQWRYISLTGVNASKPKLYFGGPLTEVTACDQAGSCGSISNVDAWSKLWSAISAQPQTRQYDMPHGTDLRIN